MIGTSRPRHEFLISIFTRIVYFCQVVVWVVHPEEFVFAIFYVSLV